MTNDGLIERMNSALSHDFCPWANRWVYWLKNPVWSLIFAVIISVACGIMVNPMAFLLTAILLTITAIGVILPWITMRGIDGHLMFDIRRSRSGKPVLVRLRIRNRCPWPAWGISVVRGFALRDTADTDEGVALARIPGWSTAEFTWQFIPVRRGRYPLTTPEIETGFPFGMYRCAKPITADGYLIVWPDTVTLNGMPDSCATDASDEVLADRRIGDHGDLTGTRPFRNGDSLRRVHWSQTARQQRLIVCERQAPAMSSVRVVLDHDPESYPEAANTVPAEQPLEVSVRVAASICESLYRQNARVELSLGEQFVVAGESAASFQRLMDALAQFQPQPDASRSRRTVTHSGNGQFMIGISTSAGLLRNGGRWKGHHIVSIGESGGSDRESRGLDGNRGARTWLRIADAEAVSTHLPEHWKRACNVR